MARPRELRRLVREAEPYEEKNRYEFRIDKSAVSAIISLVFGAGCDSPPAVESASARALIRCDSGTDSTVWMEEDGALCRFVFL